MGNFLLGMLQTVPAKCLHPQRIKISAPEFDGCTRALCSNCSCKFPLLLRETISTEFEGMVFHSWAKLSEAALRPKSYIWLSAVFSCHRCQRAPELDRTVLRSLGCPSTPPGLLGVGSFAGGFRGAARRSQTCLCQGQWVKPKCVLLVGANLGTHRVLNHGGTFVCSGLKDTNTICFEPEASTFRGACGATSCTHLCPGAALD